MSFTIDVHHHFLPDFFWRETNDGAHPVGGIAPPPWDRAGALDPAVPIEDTIGAIADLVKAGYVRYIALSEMASDISRLSTVVPNGAAAGDAFPAHQRHAGADR
jgi:hypothetical protein